MGIQDHPMEPKAGDTQGLRQEPKLGVRTVRALSAAPRASPPSFLYFSIIFYFSAFEKYACQTQ